MKYSIICILILLYTTSKAFERNDSVKLLQSSMSLMIEYQKGTFINGKSTNISLVPTTITGGEFTIKIRNKKSNLSFNLGVNYRFGMTDTALLRKSLNEYFSRNYTKVAVYLQARNNNYAYSSIGMSPSISKIIQYKRFMVEPFLKMNVTFFDIGNYAIISCADLNTNQHVEKELYFRQQNLNLVPALGTWAAIKLAKVVYFTSKIEMGYNVSNQKINMYTRYTNNEIETIPIHFPRSYIIGSIGLHLIPFNRISKKEYAKWSPAKMKRFENSL